MDDVDLVGKGIVEINEMFVQMMKKSTSFGLKINENETKYFTLDRKHGSFFGQNNMIDEFKFEVVQSFRYLRSIVNVGNDINEEIRRRFR